MRFSLYSRFVPQASGLPPLFNNAALLEWIKQSDDRFLEIASDYLSSALLSFLDALKEVGLHSGVAANPLASS